MKTVTAELLPNGNLQVSVPLSLKQTGGVTRIIVPGEEAADPGRHAFLLAVARGRRWQQLIDEGKVENIKAQRRSSGVTSAVAHHPPVHAGAGNRAGHQRRMHQCAIVALERRFQTCGASRKNCRRNEVTGTKSRW